MRMPAGSWLLGDPPAGLSRPEEPYRRAENTSTRDITHTSIVEWLFCHKRLPTPYPGRGGLDQDGLEVSGCKICCALHKNLIFARHDNLKMSQGTLHLLCPFADFLMTRAPRLDAPGVLHHVMARGIERHSLFSDNHDRDDFLRRLAALAAAGALATERR